MLKKGCSAYLYAVEAVKTQEPDPREIPIVEEFLGVFPGFTPRSGDRIYDRVST